MEQQFTAEQTRAIMARVEKVLSSRGAAPAPMNYKCMGCEVALNATVGEVALVLVAAGIAVGPEAAGVVSMAGATGLEASTVVTIINGNLALGGAAAAEAIITGLCKAMGAC